MNGRNQRSTVSHSPSISEDDELAQIAQQIACPNCGDLPVSLVEVLSPDEVSDESVKAFKNGLKGALVGGITGAPLGPGGIGLGMAGGALIGSDQGRKQAKKERLVVSCPCCGYHGRCD
ncbi:hypothetical protein G6M89_21650 [Natronolimnobius sp. AArcel1]|uniref:hypothetical protein n=1 Tax=Natronolimnobius sp. AArcel1 TaxID=1679093 RepID=UPI0013EC271A|nr:hypothetical protein [Natronolimnobius sp. AArcel1]NGM71553.1 hypothetical protein [Natronolimnobius sp. AArcel1]